jgi:hypothetical protein
MPPTSPSTGASPQIAQRVRRPISEVIVRLVKMIARLMSAFLIWRKFERILCFDFSSPTQAPDTSGLFWQ